MGDDEMSTRNRHSRVEGGVNRNATHCLLEYGGEGSCGVTTTGSGRHAIVAVGSRCGGVTRRYGDGIKRLEARIVAVPRGGGGGSVDKWRGLIVSDGRGIEVTSRVT